MKKKEEFETTEIGLTAFLVLHEQQPKADINDLGLVSWKFEKSKDLKKLLEDYDNNSLIGVVDYNKTISMLKRGMKYILNSRRNPSSSEQQISKNFAMQRGS